jgi:hypothetical protein
MRKFLYALILISIASTSCDKGDDGDLDDLKKENQELREALAANSKITNVEFTETEMIMTYSNGLKLTSPIPDVLKGKPGDTPRIGDIGNWWIGDTDTGVIAQGQNGSEGANGADGNSPYIGDNGNWWISESDTGIAAMGKDGADGADGVGIKSITYDPSTGMMTITLTNDQLTKFVVASNSDGDLSAKILEDLNGKYVMTKATMGDIPFAEIEYNDENQITKMTSYTANGYQVFKCFEVEKTYDNGKPSKIVTRRFATEKTVKYSDEYYVNTITKEVELDDFKGDKFVVENSDGSFYYYEGGYELNSGKYSYYKYYAKKQDGADTGNEMVSNGDGTFKVFVYQGDVMYNDVDYDYYRIYDECYVYDESQEDYNKTVKISNNQFKRYRYNHGYFIISGVGVYKYFYCLSIIRTIEGSYESGDLMSETFAELEYNSSNQLVKIYESRKEGVEASAYMQNYYGVGNIIKTENYIKNEGNWQKESKYLTYEYNSQNLLTQTIEHDAEGNEKITSKVIYDLEGNPIEIFKFFSEVVDRHGIVNPETGIRVYQDVVVAKAGLYSYAKLEYNYTMKNFFGNTFAGLFPELYGFNFNNALKRVSISNSINAGAIEYKDFNDGGYPETMEFIGGGEDESYIGQLKIEYLKIEE